MQISNNFSVTGVDATRALDRNLASKPQVADSASSAGLTLPIDQLDLSTEALAVGTQETSEPFRADRVAELRQLIAQGNYDTDERLSEAFNRMLDRLA